MNLLEWMGVIFMAQMAVLITAAVMVHITGGVELFDEQPSREDIDRLAVESDEEASSRPHFVRVFINRRNHEYRN